MSDINIEKAFLDPGSLFDHPQEVMNSPLATEDKIKILRRWEYDARELDVAAEENMSPEDHADHNLLQDIRNALIKLGVNTDEDSPPTKQGGE